MRKAEELRQLLEKIDHKGYPAYKETKGQYEYDHFILSIDHVQGDPFASPSNVSILVVGEKAGFPQSLYDTKEKRIALQDFLLREFGSKLQKYSFKANGSGKSGLMAVSKCGQEILERSACQINTKSGDVLVRMEIGFPANGRTVNARELSKILFDFLPQVVRGTLFYKSLDQNKLQKTEALAEDQTIIRSKLQEMGLIAFVANGSILPRESGISGKPMKGAIAFQSPKTMEVEIQTPNLGCIRGMGIKKGITLIVGGGYHGKSTLLKALELGVYNHIAGDGREYVITDNTAMKIRAEDGRSIQQVDISMFINHLPNGTDTKCFFTEDASGSTSQAANVIESIEAGSKVLLIDEDTSATNFMTRDELMQRVVHKEKEPITPYVDRIKELYDNWGISTILVAGSSGAYFEKADKIIQMDEYRTLDITEFAKIEANKYYKEIKTDTVNHEITKPNFQRKIKPDREWKNERTKIRITETDTISVNKTPIDMRYVEQLIDSEQMQMLGLLLAYAQRNLFDGKKTLQEVVTILVDMIEVKGMESLYMGNYVAHNLAKPREQEIYACFNRYRKLHFMI